jgi:mannose-6-phosphate isomerase-like protein (cupin superfamily)
MTAVIRAGAGRLLSLPGRTSAELVSAAEGGYGVTVRRVTIPPEPGRARQAPQAGEAGAAGQPVPAAARGPHTHEGCEEVIAILAGTGEFVTDAGVTPVGPGDLVVVSPGEPHRTRNTGSTDLVSLCFFPVPDLAAVSRELPGPPPAGEAGS